MATIEVAEAAQPIDPQDGQVQEVVETYGAQPEYRPVYEVVQGAEYAAAVQQPQQEGYAVATEQYEVQGYAQPEGQIQQQVEYVQAQQPQTEQPTVIQQQDATQYPMQAQQQQPTVIQQYPVQAQQQQQPAVIQQRDATQYPLQAQQRQIEQPTVIRQQDATQYPQQVVVSYEGPQYPQYQGLNIAYQQGAQPEPAESENEFKNVDMTPGSQAALHAQYQKYMQAAKDQQKARDAASVRSRVQSVAQSQRQSVVIRHEQPQPSGTRSVAQGSTAPHSPYSNPPPASVKQNTEVKQKKKRGCC